MLQSLSDALARCARGQTALLGLLSLVSCAQRPPLHGDVLVGRYVEPSRRFTFRLPGYAGTDGLVDRIEGNRGELQIGGMLGTHGAVAWSPNGTGAPVLPLATIEAWSGRIELLLDGFGPGRTRVSSGFLPSENGEFFHEIWEVHREGSFAANQALYGFALCADPATVVWLADSMVLWNPDWMTVERHGTDEEIAEERLVLRELIERISFDDPLLSDLREQDGRVGGPPGR